MSQIYSQSPSPDWISIPLMKFSHHSGLYGSTKHTWTHVSLRNDIYLVIQHLQVRLENGLSEIRSIMKVSAGAELIEQQNLGELVKAVQELDPSSGAEYPIHIITQCPFMAMLYPKSVNTVRRIQLKFHNETDFTKVVNRLRFLGLPVMNRPSASSAPLSTHSASSSFMGTAVSSNRPSSSGEFRIPLRPDTAGSEVLMPSSTFSHFSDQATRPQSASSTSSISNTPSSIASRLPFHGTASSGESIYLSQIHKASNIPPQRIAPSPTAIHGGPIATDSLFVNQMQNEDRGVLDASQKVKEPVRALAASPFFPPPQNGHISLAHSTASLKDHLYQKSLSNQPRLTLFNAERPASTPSKSIDWDLWVPTRQPVPLLNLGDNDKRRSLSDLPSLPIPTPVNGKDSASVAERTAENASSPIRKIATKRVAQRKSTLNKLQDSVVSPENSSVPGADRACVTDTYLHQDEPSPLAAKTAAASRPSSAAPGLQSKAIVNKKRAPSVRPPSARPPSAAKRRKMVDQATQTQILCLSTKPKVPTLVSNISEKSIGVTRPASPPEEYLDRVDAFVTKHKSRPAPKEISETPGYADADEETRLAIINDFICENLENEDFLTLCDDMGKSWQRIGLGINIKIRENAMKTILEELKIICNEANQLLKNTKAAKEKEYSNAESEMVQSEGSVEVPSKEASLEESTNIYATAMPSAPNKASQDSWDTYLAKHPQYISEVSRRKVELITKSVSATRETIDADSEVLRPRLERIASSLSETTEENTTEPRDESSNFFKALQKEQERPTIHNFAIAQIRMKTRDNPSFGPTSFKFAEQWRSKSIEEKKCIYRASIKHHATQFAKYKKELVDHVKQLEMLREMVHVPSYWLSCIPDHMYVEPVVLGNGRIETGEEKMVKRGSPLRKVMCASELPEQPRSIFSGRRSLLRGIAGCVRE